MIAAFFRPPAKQVPQQAPSRPASPPMQMRDGWALVDDRSSGSIEASLPSLSELDDVFDDTPAHSDSQTPTQSPPSTVRSTMGLPTYWGLGTGSVSSPSEREMASASRDLVMPGSSNDSFPVVCVPRPASPEPGHHVVNRAVPSLRALALPVGSAIAASCATVAYHAVGTVIAASYDVVPYAVVPAGLSFITTHYPVASLIGTAAGSLWGLHQLCRPGQSAGNARANRASMCISALTTSFWLFTMGPAALVGSAGYVAMDLAQPAAQTYLLGALGLIYNYDWTGPGRPDDGAAFGSRLMLQVDDVADFLALSESQTANPPEQP